MNFVNENIQNPLTYDLPRNDLFVITSPVTSKMGQSVVEKPRLAPHVAEWDAALSAFQRQTAENAMRQAGVEVTETL